MWILETAVCLLSEIEIGTYATGSVFLFNTNGLSLIGNDSKRKLKLN